MGRTNGRSWAAGAIGTILLLGASGVLGACSSSGSAKSADTPGTSNATGSPADSKGTNTGTPGTAANGTRSVTVDLVMTGDRPAKIKGTKGSCDIPSNSTLAAGYNFSGADYPVLGPQGNFNVTGPQKATASGQRAFTPSIKVLIGDAGFLDTDGSGIKVSPDQTEIQLDADISGSTAGTANAPGAPLHGHVTGTMTCS